MMQLVGFKTGFCHFCRYETETKPYPRYTDEYGKVHKDARGTPIKCCDVYLCEFCCMLSPNDMKNTDLRVLNWGLNHILKKLKGKNEQDN